MEKYKFTIKLRKPNGIQKLMFIDGVQYTRAEFARKTGIKESTVMGIIRNYGDSNEEFDREVKRRLKHGRLIKKGRRYYRGEKSYTASELVKKTGLSMPAAVIRLKKWEEGYYTDDEVVAPVGSKGLRPKPVEKSTGKPDWKGLGSKVRDKNLRKIPSPTVYEKRIQ